MFEKISKYLAVTVATLSVIIFPVVTFAANTGLRNLVSELGGLIQALIPIVIGLGVLIFVWGVLQYVLTDEESGKEKGRMFMLWGIIALFVMVSVWGLVNILRETLMLNNATPSAPGIPKVNN
jgi:hypothetical protein